MKSYKLERRPTILLVDDALENVITLNAALENNYLLKITNDFRQACIYADETPPDLVLLYLTKSDIGGLEACRQLKANPKLAAVPVIFIKAKNDMSYTEKGNAIETVDFISKPFTASIVSAQIRAHIKVKFMMERLKSGLPKLQKNVGHAALEIKDSDELHWGKPYDRTLSFLERGYATKCLHQVKTPVFK